MRLVTYDTGRGPCAGVLVDEGVVDVAALLDLVAPVSDVRALLELPGEPLNRIRELLERGGAPSTPLDQVRLRAPVLQPPTVRDFMVYEGHASGGGTRKLAEAWYRMPIFYFSNTLRISGPEDELAVPSATDRLDYELELGCVIGREGSNVRAADGLEYIAGFTIFNDWSARDLQFDEMDCRLGPAKGKDAATTLGPWLVTTDEMSPYLRDGRLHVRCSVRVNGQTWMENGEGGQMYHTWGDLVERASRDSRIVPGDVFGTGTVSGGTIGEAIQRGYPARYLQPGDMVELEVEGIGILRNRLGPKVDEDPGYRYRAPAKAAS